MNSRARNIRGVVLQKKTAGEIVNKTPVPRKIGEVRAAAETARETAKASVAFPPIGAMIEWAGAVAPADGKWLLCHGKVLQQSSYPALYSVLSGTFNLGNEPAGHFRIPDRRGRVGVGAGFGAGLTNRPLGDTFGEEKHELIIAELAAHGHSQVTGFYAHSHGGGVSSSAQPHAVVGRNFPLRR